MPSLSQPSSGQKAAVLPPLSWKGTNGSFSTQSGKREKSETIEEGMVEKKINVFEQHEKESLSHGKINVFNHSLPDGKTV